MLDFKDQKLMPLSVAAVIGFIIMIANLGFIWTIKKPAKATKVNPRISQLKQANDAIVLAGRSKKEAEKEVNGMVWTISVEELGPTALGAVNKMIDPKKLKVTSFRPQRALPVKGLTMVPYTLSVEGSFLDVVSLARNIDKDPNKMSVTMLQISSADANTDKVAATINLTAFVDAVAAEKLEKERLKQVGLKEKANG